MNAVRSEVSTTARRTPRPYRNWPGMLREFFGG